MLSTKTHFLQYRPGILFLDPCPIHHFRLVTKNKTAKFIRSFYFVGLKIYELQSNSFKMEILECEHFRHWFVSLQKISGKTIIIRIGRQEDANIAIRVEKSNLMAI